MRVKALKEKERIQKEKSNFSKLRKKTKLNRTIK